MSGFSLLELIVTMAISIILMSVIFPVYTHFQAHANREHAIVALFQLAARLENYYALNQTYVGADDLNTNTAQLDQDLSYHLHIAAVTETDYKIEANPIGAQISHDAACGSLFLNSSNEKSISGLGDATSCWK